ncbi:MAG: hypothetical protein JEY91_18490, partial [Spirochaetaceae bacterium]|nr:hypothetical protein [Spirochaetaceae bacterium]
MRSNIVTYIQLPSGATITPTYTPAPQTPGAINPSDSGYPDISNKSPRSLVTSLEVSDGMGNNPYRTSYAYSNGKIHKGSTRDETKSLGFEWTQKTNPDGSFTKTYYYQEEALANAGVPKRIENYGSDGKIYSATEHIYSVIPILAAAGGYHAVNSIQKTNTYSYNFNGMDYVDWNTMKGRTDILKTRLRYLYDSNGNRTHFWNYGDLSDISDDTLSHTSYIKNDSKYIFVPRYTQEISYALDGPEGLLNGTDNRASLTYFYYDNNTSNTVVGDKGLVTKTRSISGKSGEIDKTKYPDLVIQYTHDVYGNVLTITDGEGNVSSIEYDGEYHSLPVKKINDNNLTVESIKYDSFMRPERIADINENYTWFTYDSFSRQTAVHDGDADGRGRILSRTEYSDKPAEPGSPSWIKTESYLPNNSNEYVDSFTYFDGLGRKIQEKTEGVEEDNTLKWATTDYHYEIQLKTTSISEPYFSSNSDFNQNDWDQSKDETVQYLDDIGRVKSIEYPDGNEEHYAYGLRDKTTLLYNSAAPENSQITFEEIVGRDQITYSYGKSNDYHPASFAGFQRDEWKYRVTTRSARDGVRINEISGNDYFNNLSDGNTLLTLVDYMGRKKSYSDPDMGTWTYEYDKNGNLKKQTDANNQSITFTYDNLNRVIKKVGAHTVTYNYNESGHGLSSKERLTSIDFAGISYSEDYYYDDTKKEYSITKTIDGISRTYATTLDELGRVIEESLPGIGSETLTYSYNKTGNIDSISGKQGIQYISGLRYDIFGKIRDFTQGNGIVTSYGYNDNHRLDSIDISGAIAHMTFKYDNLGNITEKVFDDGLLNYRELYEYDDFFRLSKAESGELYGIKTYEYDSYNNMIKNNGRIYKYDSQSSNDGGPHAVQEIEDQWGNLQKQYEYDDNGNVTKITGQSHLVIRAKWSGGVAKPPKMELWINGEKPETTWTVTSNEYQIYSWHGYIPTGASIDIVYANGGLGNSLSVDFISVNDVFVHSESANVLYDRGAYSSGCFDDVNVIAGKETIWSTGALRFPVPIGAATPVRTLNYDSENRLRSIFDNGKNIASYDYNDVGQRIWKIEK